MDEPIENPSEGQTFEALQEALTKATLKLQDLEGKRALPIDEEMSFLFQNPGFSELWKRIAIHIQAAEEDDFDGISLGDVEEFLEISMGLSPTDVEARSELGFFLFAVNDETEKALNVFREARNLCLKQLAECTSGMADCLFELGQKEQARKILEQTLTLCPDSEELRESLELMAETGPVGDDS